MSVGIGGAMRARFWRRLLVLVVGLTSVAVLGGAVFLGWWLHGRLAKDRTAVVNVNRPIRVAEPSLPSVGTAVPNVLGLDVQTARQVFVDAGIDPKRLETTGQPYAGEQGIVISQDPASGSSVGTGKLTLTLSTSAQMPKLVGGTLTEARAALAGLGASVAVTARYQPNTTENTVLETEPKVGAPLRERATLVVAEPPSSVFLNELRPINSSCGTQTVNAAGVERPNAFDCEPGQGSPSVMEYLLNRRVASFAAVLSLGDRGGTDTPVTFVVIVDGKRKLALTLRFGEARAINVPVVGALRLRLVASAGKLGSSGEQPQAVVANARLLGGRTAIDSLVSESKQ